MNKQNELQLQIDRLVDNELTPQQTTELLQQCDAEPAAWKTLALAMLETREVSAVLKELIAEPTVPPRPLMATRRMTLVLAAVCLAGIGFLAGRFVPDTQRRTEITGVGQLDNQPDNAAPGEEEQAGPTRQGSKGLEVVGFAQILHRAGREAPVPVIAGPGLDYAAILQQSPKVPEDVLRQYKNRGLAVEANRRVMSLELADGQRFAIPMDKLGLRFVGNEIL